MEILRGGRLSHLIKKRKKENNPLSSLEISMIMGKILEAIKYIHSKEIVH
jgi:serine/threonine protein kinase